MRAPAVEQKARVTEITLSRVFHGIAITGENTCAFVCRAARGFSGEVFRHGCFLQGVPAGVDHGCGLIGQQFRGLEIGGHVGNFGLDELEFADGFGRMLPVRWRT